MSIYVFPLSPQLKYMVVNFQKKWSILFQYNKIALCYSSMWAKIALRYELDEWYHQNLFIHSSGKYTVQNHDTTGSVSAEGHFLKL